MEIHVFAGDEEEKVREEVKVLKFQFPYGVLRVEEKPNKAIFYHKEQRWSEEGESVKAAAVVLAAINGKEEWDKLEEELINFLFKSYKAGEISVDHAN